MTAFAVGREFICRFFVRHLKLSSPRGKPILEKRRLGFSMVASASRESERRFLLLVDKLLTTFELNEVDS